MSNMTHCIEMICRKTECPEEKKKSVLVSPDISISSANIVYFSENFSKVQRPFLYMHDFIRQKRVPCYIISPGPRFSRTFQSGGRWCAFIFTRQDLLQRILIYFKSFDVRYTYIGYTYVWIIEYRENCRLTEILKIALHVQITRSDIFSG